MLLLLPPDRFVAQMTLRLPTCQEAVGQLGYAPHSDSQVNSHTRRLDHVDFHFAPTDSERTTTTTAQTSALARQHGENAGDKDGERLMKSPRNCPVDLSVTSPSSAISPGVNWM
jgi:hypothetical protein